MTESYNNKCRNYW